MAVRSKMIISAAVAAVILLGVAAYSLFVHMNGNSPVSASAPTSTSAAGGGGEVVLPAVEALPSAPTGTMVTIGTPDWSVQVNNFYRSNPMVTDGGETVILANNSDYAIMYDTVDSSFWLGFESSRFPALQKAAEADLLSLLGISQKDACKLDVTEGVFYSSTSSLVGNSLPLSFCSSSTAF